MKSKRMSKTEVTLPRKILCGTVIAIAFITAVAGLFALLIQREVLQESVMEYIAYPIVFAAVFIGSALNGRGAGVHSYIPYLLIGLAYLTVMVSINIIFLDGTFNGLGWMVLHTAGGCICGWALTMKKRKANVKRRYRK